MYLGLGKKYMNKIVEKLHSLVSIKSDINEHLFTLAGLASDCEHITEVGVRDVVSSWALLSATPKTLVMVDIQRCPVEEILSAAKDVGVDATFVQADSIDPNFNLAETDLLFIDTWHCYAQLKEELRRHSDKARKYLAFHDTTTFGYRDESGYIGDKSGLMPAINEFLAENSHWGLLIRYENCNGLTILKRNNT